MVASTSLPIGLSESVAWPIELLGFQPLPYNAYNIDPNATAAARTCPLEYIVTGLLAGVVSAAGIVGNVLSLFTFRRERRHATVFLLKALAAADTCFLSTHLLLKSVPTTLSASHVGTRSVFNYLVLAFYPVLSASYTAGIWVTAVLAAYRLVAVSCPLQAAYTATLRRARVAVAVIVVVSALLEVPRYFEMRIERDEGTGLATVHPTDLWYERLYQLVYRSILMTGARVLLPCVGVVLLTLRLVVSLLAARRERARLVTTRSVSKEDFRYGIRGTSGEQTLASTSVTVILVFILCMTPTVVYPVVRLFTPVDTSRCDSSYAHVVIISEFLLVVNATVNFVIYFLMRATFRRNFRRAFGCARRVRVGPEGERGNSEHTYLSLCGGSGPNSITSEGQVQAKF